MAKYWTATTTWASPKWCPQLLLMLIFLNSSHVFGELPQKLDAFLERLFETTECETFLSDASFLAVSTRECPPHLCDFPRQLCMRPSDQYQQESANQCRTLPDQCLKAANGGQPLPAPAPSIPAATIPPPPPPLPSTQITEQPQQTTLPPQIIPNRASSPPPPPVPSLPTIPSHSHGPICEQGPPEGRFCGFALKFAYNRETRSCDQFWFPGCRTEKTNGNLFNTLQECLHAARHCARGNPIFRPQPSAAGQAQVGPSPVPSPSWPDRFGGEMRPPHPQPPPSVPSAAVVQPQRPVETPFGQASQFIRLITNTIRDVRDRGGTGGGGGGAPQGGQLGQGLRWDPSQLGGILQSLGGRR